MPPSVPATRVEAFDFLVPAGTPKAAPLELPTPWNAGELAGVEVFIPDGHNGTTGLRIAFAHQPVIPRTEGAWIIGNDEKIDWPLTGYGNSGAWSLYGYNSDLFDHTFHVRYLVADFGSLGLTAPAVAAATPLLT